MRALLDTHAFLWFCSDDKRLSDTARLFIESEANDISLSSASAWEIAIKFSLGRMTELGREHPEVYIPARTAHYSLTPMPILFDHVFRVAHLPPIHRDPFDRLLIAQAQVENLPIVTNDPHFARYDVEVIW